MGTLDLMIGLGSLAVAGSIYGLYQSAKIAYINMPDLHFRYIHDSTCVLIDKSHSNKKTPDDSSDH